MKHLRLNVGMLQEIKGTWVEMEKRRRRFKSNQDLTAEKSSAPREARQTDEIKVGAEPKAELQESGAVRLRLHPVPAALTNSG